MADEVPPVSGGFALGAQIAGYRLAEQIGWGGMAVVYRAHDIRLGRWVALKILAPEIARDESFRQRFISESRAAAAVDHPHIIPVFEAGDAGGVLFIAMRYVGGGDVRKLVRRLGPLDAARATSIISQVASALDAAHAAGLVHRDVKPANMLLGTVAGSGRPDHVYLSDFGLSKQALATVGLTQTGQFVGTLDYMAPEQIESRPVDGRADLYSLGCAAFEMLAGQPPVNRGQHLGRLFAQLAAPPPPLTAHRPDLPPAIDQVLARALAKLPDDRFQSCLDFAASLRVACGLEWDASGQLRSGPPGAATQLAGPVRPGAGPVRPGAGPVRPGAGPTAVEPGLASPDRWPAGQGSSGPGPPGPGPAGPGPPGPGPYGQGQYGQARYEQGPGGQATYGRGPDGQATSRQESYGQESYGQRSPGEGSYGQGSYGEGSYGQGSSGSGPVTPYLPPVQYSQQAPRGRSRSWSLAIAAIVVLIILGVAGGVLAYLRQAGPAPTRAAGRSSPTATASQAGHARSASPAGTVRAYIAAINSHDYIRAWSLGGRNSASSYPAFRQGFSTTARDTLAIESVSGNVVTAQLTARQTDGSVKTYHGTYTVENGVITKFNVRQTS